MSTTHTDTIRLYLTPQGWVADMSQASDAIEIRELFGTDQIPTAFTPQAEPNAVLSTIARLNPQDRIIL